MDFKDYYATLGVPKTATDKEIKQAFRKLARKHHPDVNPNDKTAEAKFKEINEANEVLKDPEKRAAYDQMGSNWKAGQDVSGESDFGGFRTEPGSFGDVRVDLWFDVESVTLPPDIPKGADVDQAARRGEAGAGRGRSP